jgi:hypothetical protein
MWSIRNITTEASHSIRTCTAEDYPWPERGSEGCICREPGARRDRDFLLLIDRHGEIQWYARMTCPIHGPKIKTVDVGTESTT